MRCARFTFPFVVALLATGCSDGVDVDIAEDATGTVEQALSGFRSGIRRELPLVQTGQGDTLGRVLVESNDQELCVRFEADTGNSWDPADDRLRLVSTHVVVAHAQGGEETSDVHHNLDGTRDETCLDLLGRGFAVGETVRISAHAQLEELVPQGNSGESHWIATHGRAGDGFVEHTLYDAKILFSSGWQFNTFETSFNFVYLRDLWVRVVVPQMNVLASSRLVFTNPGGELFYEQSDLFSTDPTIQQVPSPWHPIAVNTAHGEPGRWTLDQYVPIGGTVFGKYPNRGNWEVTATVEGFDATVFAPLHVEFHR